MAYVEMIPCPICKRLYHTEEGLKVHMQRNHDVELISISSVEIEVKAAAPEGESQKGSAFHEGQWVEVVENGKKLCKAFVIGAGTVSAYLEILGSNYTPGMVYTPMKKEIKNEFVHPISDQLTIKDHHMLQDYFMDLALMTKDFEWCGTLSSK